MDKLNLDLSTAGELYDFKNICILALRYALGRHTYVVAETCDYIKRHADIILDKRVIGVMLRDIELQIHSYDDEVSNGTFLTNIYGMDRDTLLDLKEFLIRYDKFKFGKASED